MSGDIPPLLQYAFMAWCLVKEKAQGQLYLLDRKYHINYREQLVERDFNWKKRKAVMWRSVVCRANAMC
jgi:hypothetical protein